MKHRRSFLPYLLILIGIILPIFLMQHLMQTTAHKGGVAKKDIPSNAVTSTASAQGMNGPVEVEVIATPEKICSVKVLSHTETEGIGSVAVAELPEKIFKNQSYEIDAVSGATLTSKAIHDAVKAALENGGIDSAPFSVAVHEVKEKRPDETIDTDIVIVGGGGAGMTAAIEAANAGKKIVILESQGMAGGNSIRSTGGMNAGKTPEQDKNSFDEAAGVEKTLKTAEEKYADNATITALAATVREQWAAYQAAPSGYFDSVALFELDTMIGGKGINNPELVHALASNSADAIQWLESVGAPLPSVSSFGGASVKRIHRPVNAEGKTVSVGTFMLPILEENAKKLGADLRLETRAKKLLVDESGKIVGVEAEGPTGEKVTVNAKAVILASGGFGANLEMVTKYRPELEGFMTTNAKGALGDGILMGDEVGAATVDLEQIQIHPTVEMNTAALITEGLRGDGAILMNSNGQRFTDEVGTRDAVSAAEIKQPGSFAYLIVDQAMVDASNVIQGYIKKGYTTQGESYAALAEALQIDPTAFETTMNEWNAAVEAKTDSQFGRTSFASPLNTAPYYAIKVTPGVHHTMGGLKINSEAEVLSADGNKIPGLFAAGEVTGGVHGANRLGGNAVADFVVFGRIAGKQAASYLAQN
nr:flavocytochrome c [uncultured Stomatobaculum sp.]